MKSITVDSEANEKISQYIHSLPSWQQQNLIQFRTLVHKIEPSISEDWKWNVPVFLIDGTMLFAMSAFKAHTKYNFILNGAKIDDSDALFNNGLESKTSRSIDLKENEVIDSAKLSNLIERAVIKGRT